MKSCPVCDSEYPDQHTNCPTDGAVLMASHELAAGSLVRGKYRILSKLGQGGMGVVYRAEHILLGGQAALKFLAPELSRNPQFIKRFRNEARAAFQLRHPNIIEVLDLDQAEDGSLFIAMEFVAGESLRAAIGQARGGMAVGRALAIARGIASGLAAAHARGTVHRDIKPENILLASTSEGVEQPKVLDFGIAAMLEGATAVSRTRGLMLTPEYASPEQWRGTPANELDGRTDLYALGGVLYEMLAGQTPFHAHNMEGWMFQHLQETPAPPSRLRPELTAWPGLDDLVMRLLARERNDRPGDADALRLLDAVLYTPYLQYDADDEVVETPARVFQEPPNTVIVAERERPETVIEERPEQVFEQIGDQIQGQLEEQPPPPEAAKQKSRWRKLPWWARAALAFVAFFAIIFVALLSGAGTYIQQYWESASLSSSCHQGDASACYYLGERHDPGDGTAEDAAKAREYFSKALTLASKGCDNGDGRDCYYQGRMYRWGNGVAHDDARAAALFAKSCDNGYDYGCGDLSDMYRAGEGVAKDDAKAQQLTDRACAMNQGFKCYSAPAPAAQQ